MSSLPRIAQFQWDAANLIGSRPTEPQIGHWSFQDESHVFLLGTDGSLDSCAGGVATVTPCQPRVFCHGPP